MWFCRLWGCRVKFATISCSFGAYDTAEGIDIAIFDTSKELNIDGGISPVSVSEEKALFGAIIFGLKDTA